MMINRGQLASSEEHASPLFGLAHRLPRGSKVYTGAAVRIDVATNVVEVAPSLVEGGPPSLTGSDQAFESTKCLANTDI